MERRTGERLGDSEASQGAGQCHLSNISIKEGPLRTPGMR